MDITQNIFIKYYNIIHIIYSTKIYIHSNHLILLIKKDILYHQLMSLTLIKHSNQNSFSQKKNSKVLEYYTPETPKHSNVNH